MKIFVKKIDGVELPVQGTDKSAGYDIISTHDPIIVGESIEIPMDGLKLYKSIDYIEYKTSLCITPENTNERVEIYPRSSISKKNLILANGIGLIDADYNQELLLRFKYIPMPEDFLILPEVGINKIYCRVNRDKIYEKGNKIGQLVGKNTNYINFEFVDKLPSTSRIGGFGSTGK